MKILIIGAGGREDAIGTTLFAEGHEIISTPGNPGLARYGKTVPMDMTDKPRLVSLAKQERVDLTIVGPELLLAIGIVDDFTFHGLPSVGPTMRGARLEASKIFCHQILRDKGIPVPSADYYYNFRAMAESAIARVPPFVIKYNHLADGKGVEVILTKHDLAPAFDRLSLLADHEYMIQQWQDGVELSYIVITDGISHKFLGSALDYKRVFEKNRGPNTGGMGAVSPHPMLTPALQEQIEREIVEPTIAALMLDRKLRYRGILYFGLIITPDGPVVIEINCRFGDPETQVMLPLLDCELLPLLWATTQEDTLCRMEVRFRPQMAVGIVLCSKGYPDPKALEIHKPITGLTDSPIGLRVEDYASVFHAGTRIVNGKLVTAGGRVLTVVGQARRYDLAKNKAMAAANLIEFEGKHYRHDIADMAIAAQSGQFFHGSAQDLL